MLLNFPYGSINWPSLLKICNGHLLLTKNLLTKTKTMSHYNHGNGSIYQSLTRLDAFTRICVLFVETLAPSSATKRSLFIKSTPKRTVPLDDSFPQELDQTPSRLDGSNCEKRRQPEPSLGSPESTLTVGATNTYLYTIESDID